MNLAVFVPAVLGVVAIVAGLLGIAYASVQELRKADDRIELYRALLDKHHIPYTLDKEEP